MNVETEEDLYFDEEKETFFVVESTEYETFNASPSHWTRPVSPDQARKLLAGNEIGLEAANKYLDRHSG